MPSPDVGLPRAARALALVALVVGVSVVSHGLAGGHTPAAPVLIGLGTFLLPFALVLTGRRLSTGRVVAGLGLGQVAAHLTLGVLGGHAADHVSACTTAGAATGHAAHLGHLGLQCTTGSLPMPGAAASLAPSFIMVVAHLVATVVLAAAVLRGEALLYAVLALLLPRLIALLHAPVPSVRLRAPAPTPLRPRLGWAPRSGRAPPVRLAH